MRVVENYNVLNLNYCGIFSFSAGDRFVAGELVKCGCHPSKAGDGRPACMAVALPDPVSCMPIKNDFYVFPLLLFVVA